MSRAWGDPALYPEELRNYVHRLRQTLAELEIPCQLENDRGHGYQLALQPDA